MGRTARSARRGSTVQSPSGGARFALDGACHHEVALRTCARCPRPARAPRARARASRAARRRARRRADDARTAAASVSGRVRRSRPRHLGRLARRLRRAREACLFNYSADGGDVVASGDFRVWAAAMGRHAGGPGRTRSTRARVRPALPRRDGRRAQLAPAPSPALKVVPTQRECCCARVWAAANTSDARAQAPPAGRRGSARDLGPRPARRGAPRRSGRGSGAARSTSTSRRRRATTARRSTSSTGRAGARARSSRRRTSRGQARRSRPRARTEDFEDGAATFRYNASARFRLQPGAFRGRRPRRMGAAARGLGGVLRPLLVALARSVATHAHAGNVLA